MEGDTGMEIIGLDEKVEDNNKIVDDHADRFRRHYNCETDMFIDMCKNMCQDIVGCYAFVILEPFVGRWLLNAKEKLVNY